MPNSWNFAAPSTAALRATTFAAIVAIFACVLRGKATIMILILAATIGCGGKKPATLPIGDSCSVNVFVDPGVLFKRKATFRETLTDAEWTLFKKKAARYGKECARKIIAAAEAPRHDGHVPMNMIIVATEVFNETRKKN